MKCRKCKREFSKEEMKGRLCRECSKKYRVEFPLITAAAMVLLTLFLLAGSFILFPAMPGGEILMMMTAVLTVYALVLCVSGVINRDAQFALLPPVLLCVWILIVVGAMNDIPYFIRHIQGKDFIGYLLMYAIVAFLVMAVLAAFVMMVYVSAKAGKAKKLLFSDEDLMALCGFDRYARMGYYLFKARVENIVVCEAEQSTGYEQSGVLVDVNTNPDEQQMEHCREQDPYLELITDYIYRSRACGIDKIRVSDIVFSVDPGEASEPDSPGGIYTRKLISSSRKLGNMLVMLYTALVMLPAVIKLAMGIYNGKPVTNLLWVMVGLVVQCVLMWVAAGAMTAAAKNIIANIVMGTKSLGYNNSMGAFLAAADYPNVGTNKKAILRAYIVNRYYPNTYGANNGVYNACFANALFSAVVAAQAVTVSKWSNSTSCASGFGCGGGGCGGGCGGCGD